MTPRDGLEGASLSAAVNDVSGIHPVSPRAFLSCHWTEPGMYIMRLMVILMNKKTSG